MELATVSANGQITVPAEIRRALHLVPGDKVAFVTNELGDVTLVKLSDAALLHAQRAFAGATEEAGMSAEEDLDRLVAEVRVKRRSRSH